MNYKYAGVDLTPAVFTDLLIELFDGKQFERQDAIEAIKRYHVANGGILKKKAYATVFKKASQNLRDQGMEQIIVGTWKLQHKTKTIEVVVSNTTSDVKQYTVDKQLGIGEQSVYVYYYDTYKKFALQNNQQIWECKIGRTDVDPISRVISQAGTCYPEFPHIALIIYCDDSSLLEKILHNILKLNNKCLTESPGKEWFLTSPDEIERLYNSITNLGV